MANEVATTKPTPEIVKFREQLESRASEIKMALPQHITPEKFQRTIITACQQNPELLRCDRQSLVLACMKAAQDALLPDGREAAIVPFKQNYKEGNEWKSRMMATYMPMVYGLRKKILQSNEVSGLEVGVVYRAEVEGGKFIYEVGLDPPLRHRPMLELSEEQTQDSEIVAAYSIATMKDGTRSYEILRRFEIDKVRECSQTGATRDKRGNKRQPSGPWVEWFAEQAKKTAMRRHSKVLPQSGDIVIDVEGRELEAGASTAALLASREPDAPQIEDRSDETPAHDPETGEIVEAASDSQIATDEGAAPDMQTVRRQSAEHRLAIVLADFAKVKTDKQKLAASNKHAKWISGVEADFPDIHEQAMAAIPQLEGSAEGNASASGDTDQSSRRDTTPENGGSGLSSGPTAQTSASPSDDAPLTDEQLADQTDAATGLSKHPAEEIADRIIGDLKAAETVIDAQRIWLHADADVAAMPEEIAEAVTSAFFARRRELTGAAA